MRKNEQRETSAVWEGGGAALNKVGRANLGEEVQLNKDEGKN